MSTQNGERFKERLADELAFPKTSCERFDAGDEREAIRIATVLRVLFHDTTDRKAWPLSVSLLSHLNAKDKVALFSTCNPPRAAPTVQQRSKEPQNTPFSEPFRGFSFVC